MKCFLFLSVFLFLSCQGYIQQIPPATPGSGIPINNNQSVLTEPNNTTLGSNNSHLNPTNNNPLNPDPQGNQNKPAITLPSDSGWGLVRCEGREFNYEVFTNNIKRFLSTSTNPNRMNWWIKCNFNDESYQSWKGGVFLRGNVSFLNQAKFDPTNLSQNLKPRQQSSYLEIHIVDYQGNLVINPIRMDKLDELSSSANGNSFTLVFKDDKGEVKLEGRVERNEQRRDWVLSGNMSFTNYIDYRGIETNYNGFIGLFAIPACQFLACKHNSP